MFLASISVFAKMLPEDLAPLEAAATQQEGRHGSTLFTQGDPADSVWACLSGDGHVRIGATDRNSKALMVEVFRAGEIFGEVGVIDGGARTASAIVEGNLRLARIRGPAFVAALASSPELGDALCRVMALRLRRTFALFQDATFETLEVRLARQILYLASRGGRTTASGLRLGDRLRQSDLADLLGATTRSIITILNAWRASEIVAYDTDRAQLTVRDMGRLREVVGEDQKVQSDGTRMRPA
jgi:CRP/FNR family transcriptional regulator, cyclic AMP receptor protein